LRTLWTLWKLNRSTIANNHPSLHCDLDDLWMIFVDSVPGIDQNRPKSTPAIAVLLFSSPPHRSKSTGEKFLWGDPRTTPQTLRKPRGRPRGREVLLLKKLVPNVGPTLRYPEGPLKRATPSKNPTVSNFAQTHSRGCRIGIFHSICKISDTRVGGKNVLGQLPPQIGRQLHVTAPSVLTDLPV
jgi:hypothetical protein